MSFNHGLTPSDLGTIKSILSPWADAIDHVDLFGSRAKGTYKNYSDIDLVLYGDSLNQTTINRLWTLFSESALPYKVDIVAYHLVTNPAFKAHIDQYHRPLLATLL
jgi:predicted nucleotidyltransferase